MKARRITPESRIAVLGAGCAGLTCAEFLRLRGAKQVTVFEASDRAGGKVWSVPYEGAPAGGRGLFEAGTVFFVPGPVWSHVLSRYGVSTEIAPMPSVRIADLSRGRIRHPLAVSGGWSVFQRLIQTGRFLRMLERYGPLMDQKPGLQAHARPDVAIPAGEWFTQAGMPFVRQVLLPIAGGAQFGPGLDQVPALYVIRLLTLLRRYPLVNQLRLAMPQLRAGHDTVWRRVAQAHGVRFREAVQRLRRLTDGTVEVETTNGGYRFDAVISTLPPGKLAAIADFSDAERVPWSRVRTLSRVVLTARVSGLPPRVFHAPRFQDDGSIPPAHPYLQYEIDPGCGWMTFHPFLDGGRTVADAEAACRDVVARLGGRLESIEHRALIPEWFPHFGEQEVRDGLYDLLESTQGGGNLWHASELFSGISVPHATEYARQLVGRMLPDTAEDLTGSPLR